jgi:hypothetical protein
MKPCLALILALATHADRALAGPEEIVARVNGRPISKSDLSEFRSDEGDPRLDPPMDPDEQASDLRSKAKHAIDRVLLLEECLGRGLMPTDRAVRRQGTSMFPELRRPQPGKIDEVPVDRTVSPAEWRRAHQPNEPISPLLDAARARLCKDALVASETSAPLLESEVERWYLEHRNRFVTAVPVHGRLWEAKVGGTGSGEDWDAARGLVLTAVERGPQVQTAGVVVTPIDTRISAWRGPLFSQDPVPAQGRVVPKRTATGWVVVQRLQDQAEAHRDFKEARGDVERMMRAQGRAATLRRLLHRLWARAKVEMPDGPDQWPRK